MPGQEQDLLSKALLDLESELRSFGSVQNALKKAHEELTKAEQEWAALTQEQQKTALELVDATRSAIEATRAVTGQAEAMTGALLPLAKAIEQVNFPMRLDKIDLGIATQGATMASFQGSMDRGFRSLSSDVGGVQKRLSEDFADVKGALAGSRKRDILMIALMLLGLVAVICLVVVVAMRGMPSGGR